MIQSSPDLTPEEYLAHEEQADHKSEYYNGKIYALAGASINHNQITVNLTAALADHFKNRPCRVFANDVRLHVAKSGLYTYPDVMVMCGQIEFDPRQKDTVTNPTVIFEIWSESTQAYDRGQKFAMYRQIPTLRDYVMIDQTQPYIEYFRREGHFWILETVEQLNATLALHALDWASTLETIYSRVEWGAEK